MPACSAFASRRRSKPRELGSAWENGAGMGGAMDLVTGSRKVIIAMDIAPKMVQQKFCAAAPCHSLATCGAYAGY